MSSSALRLATLLLLPLLLAATGDKQAMKLADEVHKASGGKHWGKVKRIRFTFNVEDQGKPATSVKHVWNLRKGTDTVTWGDKTVTVDLSASNAEGDAKDAYRRWVNDSYWLLAPLKLKDGGVILTHKGTQEVDGESFQVLHISFENVGLSPSDQYNFYIDPKTKMVRRWDFMPNPEKRVSGTWDGYKKFGPLRLSTEHQFGDRRIYFSDVEVKSD